ncbi:MAG: sensor histidine kinase [Elusimicrobia bacterium]|nr:sensor histidine kinase [Elusimicrobiota bacterium]
MTPALWTFRALNLAAALAAAALRPGGSAAGLAGPAAACTAALLLEGALAWSGRPADAAARRGAVLAAAALGDFGLLAWLAAASGMGAGLAPAFAAAAGAAALELSALPAARAEGADRARKTLGRLRAAQVGEHLSFVIFQIRDYMITIGAVADAAALCAPKDDARLAEKLSRLRHSLRELNGKLARLLGDRSALTAARAASSASLDLGDLVRRVAAEVRDGFAPNGVRLSVRVEGEIALSRVDPRWVELSLMAVLQNAVEACAARGGAVGVRARRAGTRAEIEVSDDGGGIAEAVRPLLFQPFVAAGPHGLGLGLSTARRFLDRLGGELVVSGEQGRTSVRLSFPLEQALPVIRTGDATWADRRAGPTPS